MARLVTCELGPRPLIPRENGIMIFRICFICTGNRCRTPIAVAAMREATVGLPVEVESAGLLELPSHPPLPEIVAAAYKLGLDVTSHRSRYLGDVDLSNFDLVIGLAREHVAAAVIHGEAPQEKVFTLIELVRLLKESDHRKEADKDIVENARVAIAAAALRRTNPQFHAGEDVVDPFGGPPRGYLRMARRVRDLEQELAEGLFGVAVD